MSKRLIIFAIFIILLCGLIFAVISSTKSEPYVSSIIAPHHNLVAKQRAEMFSRIAPRTQNRPIILLSPNHYNSGSSSIQTRSEDFSTQFGTVSVDQDLIDVALANGVAENPVTYEAEHGIKALLPDIAKYYPNSSVLPLVIKETTKREELEKLFSVLHKQCSQCLLITSADFSHYQPYQLSEFHDDLTLRGLATLDGDLLDKRAELEPMHLAWATVFWAELNNTEQFVLDQHTNSTEIENDYYAEGTTHIIGWYQRGKQTVQEASASITITGSLQFDGEISKELHPNYKSVFDKLGDRVFWGTDAVVGSTLPNLNGNNQSPATISTLEFLHYSHIYNSELGANDLLVKSDIENLTAKTPEIVKGYRQDIAIFSGQAQTITDDFANYNDSAVVVYVDWAKMNQDDRRITAHKWVENGADLVVGMGSAIGESELYNNRPIIYSIGQLINGSISENSNSISLLCRFTADSIEFLPLLITQVDGKPILQRTDLGDQEISKIFHDFMPNLVDKKGGMLFSIQK